MIKIAAFLAVTIASFSAPAHGDPARARSTPPSALLKTIALPPVINQSYVYYDVCGCTEKDLHCDLMDKAIRWRDGNKYDSVTKWKVKWDYSPVRHSEGCSPDSFRLSVDITVHLPHWVPDQPVAQSLIDKWAAYMDNLIHHEHGHRDMVLEAAETLTRAVAKMAPARNCNDLEHQLRLLCRLNMQKLDESQGAYDAATGHGHAQGVSFP